MTQRVCVKKDLGELNQLHAQRVSYVANGHREGAGDFEALVAKALERWPVANAVTGYGERRRRGRSTGTILASQSS